MEQPPRRNQRRRYHWHALSSISSPFSVIRRSPQIALALAMGNCEQLRQRSVTVAVIEVRGQGVALADSSFNVDFNRRDDFSILTAHG